MFRELGKDEHIPPPAELRVGICHLEAPRHGRFAFAAAFSCRNLAAAASAPRALLGRWESFRAATVIVCVRGRDTRTGKDRTKGDWARASAAAGGTDCPSARRREHRCQSTPAMPPPIREIPADPAHRKTANSADCRERLRDTTVPPRVVATVWP